jgi:hypothetical protein
MIRPRLVNAKGGWIIPAASIFVRFWMSACNQ